MLDIKHYAYDDMKSDTNRVDFKFDVKIRDDKGKIIEHNNKSVVRNNKEEKQKKDYIKCMWDGFSEGKSPNKHMPSKNHIIIPDNLDLKDLGRKLGAWQHACYNYNEWKFKYMEQTNDKNDFIKDDGDKIMYKSFISLKINISPF